MKEVVEALVKPLVDDPGQVEVMATEDPRAIVLTVYVAQGDMGKVIGRGGRVANALRVVTRSLAPRDGRRVQVEFAPKPE